MLPEDKDIWLADVVRCPSTHCDERENETIPLNQYIDLLVIHNISLPPAQQESDFSNHYVEDFFTGILDCTKHSYFEQISELRVSSHLYIKRNGDCIQFVPLNKRAWHAGISEFKGRTRCNDFSIGIEMQGTDHMPYTDLQYQSLIKITEQLQQLFPNISQDNIVGHQHISPGRKTDPGPSFDWSRYKQELM